MIPSNLLRLIKGWVGILLFGLGWVITPTAIAQIDPEKRQLIQLGYNQPLEGKGPLAAYAYYYRNDPEFIRSNLTLRLAIAPIYVDAELGIAGLLGEHTDLGIGAAGGGFADSYFEVRQGRLFEGESFTGHGGEISSSVYHLFNPGRQIPLNAIFRVGGHFSSYSDDEGTDPAFELPDDRTTLHVRAGLRFGGKKPTVLSDLGMELSAWWEGQYRMTPDFYGFGDDREVRPDAHLFWGRALFIYTLPELKHNFSMSLTAGTSVDADRFSAYRIGGILPMASEFPLMIPGYYYQELSARRFGLLSGQYTLPLDAEQRWSLTGMGSVASVDYLPGFDQGQDFNSGLGIGLGYKSRSEAWQAVVGYGYGFNAVRSHGRGAQSIGLLVQIDLEAKPRARDPFFDIESPHRSRGLFRLFGR